MERSKRTRNILAIAAISVVLVTVAALSGFLGATYRRPGLYIRGDLVTELPSDWSFTRDYNTIAIETRTPYLLPHSIMIAVGDMGGDLYVASTYPDTKSWPTWVERDPNVRLGIRGKLYDVRLVPVVGAENIKRANEEAFYSKYGVPDDPNRPVKVWRVEPRE